MCLVLDSALGASSLRSSCTSSLTCRSGLRVYRSSGGGTTCGTTRGITTARRSTLGRRGRASVPMLGHRWLLQSLDDGCDSYSAHSQSKMSRNMFSNSISFWYLNTVSISYLSSTYHFLAQPALNYHPDFVLGSSLNPNCLYCLLQRRIQCTTMHLQHKQHGRGMSLALIGSLNRCAASFGIRQTLWLLSRSLPTAISRHEALQEVRRLRW